MKDGYFAALVLLMGLAMPAGAHTGDRVFPIPELTDEMLEEIRLDDGSIDEWYDLVGEPTMTPLDFQDPDGNPLPEPSKNGFPHLAGLARRPRPAVCRLRVQRRRVFELT